MSDYRIKYLKLMESRPLLISVVATLLLCIMSIFGLLWESDKQCRPDLRLWLIVVVIRSFVRLFCRLYVARMMTTEDNIIQQINTGSKCVDILDVFGIVWFAVGNLLVFNNFACIDVSPIVFFSSLFYICFSYLNFMVPPVLRCSLSIVRPRHPDDLAYMRRTADADREIGMVHLRSVGVGGAANLSAAYSPDLTPERVQHWSTWLEGYGCYAVSYHPSMDLLAKAGGVQVPGDLPSSLKTIAHNTGGGGGGGGKSGSGGKGGKGSGVSGVSSDGVTRYTALDQVGDDDCDIEMGTVNNHASTSNSNSSGGNSGSSGAGNTDDVEDSGVDAVTAANTATNATHTNPVPNTTNTNTTNTTNTSTHGYTTITNTIESDFCSICLTPFETVAESRQANNNTNTTSTSSSGMNSNISMIGIPSTSANNDGIIGGESGTVNRVIEDNNIIVRYPCQGHHYFHAHCLHSWLQVRCCAADQ